MQPCQEEYIVDPVLDTEDMKKIFVGGIALEASDDELKAFFEGVCGGEVTELVVIKKEGERKTHFGFVSFSNSELIDEILLNRSSLIFHGKTLDVNRACPKKQYLTGAHQKTKKLFIANIPKTGVTEEDLQQYFEARHPKKYGTINQIQLIKKKDEKGNKTEENAGYGFITVSSEDMADKMAIQHESFEFGGRKIELKKSTPAGQGYEYGGRGRGRGGYARGGGGRGSGRKDTNHHQSSGYDGYGGYGGWGGYYDFNYAYYPESGYGGYGAASQKQNNGGGSRGGKSRGGGRGRGGRGGRGRVSPY